MLSLLFAAIGAETAVAVLLLVKTPLRKLILILLDRLKRGKGPIAVRTLAVTVFIVLVSSLHGIFKIRRRDAGEDGFVGLTPTDQVLWSRRILEASLLGISGDPGRSESNLLRFKCFPSVLRTFFSRSRRFFCPQNNCELFRIQSFDRKSYFMQKREDH